MLHATTPLRRVQSVPKPVRSRSHERLALAIPRGIAAALSEASRSPGAEVQRPVGRLFGRDVVRATLQSTRPC